jgi:hypothetical protein
MRRVICFGKIRASRNAAGAGACSCRLTTPQRRHERVKDLRDWGREGPRDGSLSGSMRKAPVSARTVTATLLPDHARRIINQRQVSRRQDEDTGGDRVRARRKLAAHSSSTVFSTLCRDSRFHRLDRPCYPPRVQFGKDFAPPIIHGLRPRIGALGFGMSGKVKNVNDAFPNGLSRRCFFHGYRLNKPSRNAEPGFDGAF